MKLSIAAPFIGSLPRLSASTSSRGSVHRAVGLHYTLLQGLRGLNTWRRELQKRLDSLQKLLANFVVTRLVTRTFSEFLEGREVNKKFAKGQTPLSRYQNND